MFDRLVLSTGEKRKGRTSKFLFATSILYLLGIASALVVSVVAASPLLADDEREIIKLAPVLPQAPSLPEGLRSSSNPPRRDAAPQPNPYKVKSLEDITNQKESKLI